MVRYSFFVVDAFFQLEYKICAFSYFLPASNHKSKKMSMCLRYRLHEFWVLIFFFKLNFSFIRMSYFDPRSQRRGTSVLSNRCWLEAGCPLDSRAQVTQTWHIWGVKLMTSELRAEGRWQYVNGPEEAASNTQRAPVEITKLLSATTMVESSALKVDSRLRILYYPGLWRRVVW